MQPEAKPKAATLRSPWAQIVKAEPRQKGGALAQAADAPQSEKGSSVAAAASNSKPSPQLPSYAQSGATQHKSAPLADTKDTAQPHSSQAASSDAQPTDSEKHAPSTPAPSTSPHPHALSDSSSGTADKIPEVATAAEASSSKSSEQEVPADCTSWNAPEFRLQFVLLSTCRLILRNL